MKSANLFDLAEYDREVGGEWHPFEDLGDDEDAGLLDGKGEYRDPEIPNGFDRRLRRYLRRDPATRCAIDPLSAECESVRALVYQAFWFRCAYCGSDERLSLDHLLARSRGGSDEPGNLVAACWSCNASKGTHTLDMWLNKLPQHEREQIKSRVAEGAARLARLIQQKGR